MEASALPCKPCYGFARSEAESRPASMEASALPCKPCYGFVRSEAEADSKLYNIIKGVGLGLDLGSAGAKRGRILVRNFSRVGCATLARQHTSCATRSGLTQTGSGWCMMFVRLGFAHFPNKIHPSDLGTMAD